MRVYKGFIQFRNGYVMDDLWASEDDGMSYYTNRMMADSEIVRAEFGYYEPDDDHVVCDKYTCLFEYDADGFYEYIKPDTLPEDADTGYESWKKEMLRRETAKFLYNAQSYQ